VVYRSYSVVRIVKCRQLQWAGHVVLGRQETYIIFLRILFGWMGG
jgi:hypothetical protein